MKSDLTSRLKYGVSALAVATFTFGAQASYAADAAAEEEVAFEEVVVTGSRIKRRDIESVSPLQITGAEEVKFSGFTRIEDLLNSLPQLEAADNAFLANGATGAASLDLRGLGTVRTMVLVNGRRLQPGGIYQSAPDINQIPSGLVKSVEVMTGGASSVYGADAVAGVVNFIMDKEFEGIQVSAGITAYQHNNRNKYITPLMDARNFEYPSGSTIDGESYNIDFAIGGSFGDDKGHAVVYANWRKVEELRQGSRDYSSCALNGSGTACGGSANAIIPNYDIYPIDPNTGATIYGFDRYTQADIDSGLIADPDLIGDIRIGEDGYYSYTDADTNRVATPWASGTDANKWSSLDPSTGALIPSPSSNRYNYAPINHFQRPDERWSSGAFVDYEINEYFKPYLEVMFMRDRTKAQIAESGTFFAEEYHLACDNPIFPAEFVASTCTDYGLAGDDEIAVYVGKRNVEGGPRASLLEHTSFRTVVGSQGDLSDSWSYDASFQYGSTSSQAAYINDFFAPKIGLALDGALDDDGNLVCASGGDCIPYDVFRLNGVTADAANSVMGVAILTGITKEYVANAYVTGELPITFPTASSPISAVFGVEYRKEVFERLSDEVFEKGLLLGQGGATVSIMGAYDVKEFFTEASVPLVEDKEFAQELSLDLGLRVSDYSTTGTSTSYKIGASWQPIDEIKFRASYNRASRAPNIVELFRPQGMSLWDGVDPCSNGPTDAGPTQSAAQCANSGVTAAQYGSITHSPAGQYNNLLGGNPDLQPEIADTYTFGFVASPVDGLRISVDYWDIKVKDVISTVDEQLALDQCGLTGDAVFCDLIQRAPNGSLWLGTAGQMVATNQNLGERHLKGIDVSGDYEVELGNSGTLRTDFTGTYLIKKFYEDIKGFEDSQYSCEGKITTSCFASPKWRHSVRMTYSTDSWWQASVKWRYYSGVKNDAASAVGTINEKISAQSYFDLVGNFEITENLGLTAGINNIFDKEPPMVSGALATNANTVAGYYDTLGRYLHAKVTAKF